MLIPVRKLGEGGVATPSDFPPWDLDPARLTNSESVVIRDNIIAKNTGKRVVIDNFALTFFPRWFVSWSAPADTYVAFMGNNATNGIIYTTVDSGTLLQAVTQNNAGAAITLSKSDSWQTEIYGQWVIINNGIDPPLYSHSVAANVWTFRTIPGWGAATSPGGAVRSIRSYKNFLLAIGVASDPTTLFWSDLGNEDTFPNDWNYASTTNNAGFNILSLDDGDLVDGAHLNDRFIVFQQESERRGALTSVEATSGDEVFFFRRLWGEGLVSHTTTAHVEGNLFFVSHNNLLLFDGANMHRPADDRVNRQFYAECNDLSRVRVVQRAADSEIVIYYPMGESVAPNRQLRFNPQSNTWLFETPGHELWCIGSAKLSTAAVIWEDLEGSWESLGGSWDDLGAQSEAEAIFHLSDTFWALYDTTYKRPGSYTYRSTPTESRRDDYATEALYRAAANGAADDFYAWIERTHLDLDELTQHAGSVKFLRALYPQIRGSGLVSFQFGVSFTTRTEPVWGPIYTLDLSAPDTEYKIDMREEGRYLHYRIGSWSGVPHPGSWALSGFDLDLSVRGVR